MNTRLPFDVGSSFTLASRAVPLLSAVMDTIPQSSLRMRICAALSKETLTANLAKSHVNNVASGSTVQFVFITPPPVVGLGVGGLVGGLGRRVGRGLGRGVGLGVGGRVGGLGIGVGRGLGRGVGLGVGCRVGGLGIGVGLGVGGLVGLEVIVGSG
jgi:hypothetical protein